MPTHTTASWSQNALCTDLLPQIVGWQIAGKNGVLATLIGANKSSPRPIGTQMIINEDQESYGHISNGCIEHALINEALKVLHTKTPKKVTYGSDENFDLRLNCGASIDVFLTPIDPENKSYSAVLEARKQRKSAALFIDLKNGHVSINSPTENRATFKRLFLPPLQLFLIGNDPIVEALSSFAKSSMVEVKILPSRGSLKTELNKIHLDNRSGIICMAHDDDIDDIVLLHALKTNAGYIGVFGSRDKIKDRRKRLLSAGASLESIDRIWAPVGLNFGREDPNRTALSILAHYLQNTPELTVFGHQLND